MSLKGGMDGGWFFPVDVPIHQALQACDPGDATTALTNWTENNEIQRCISVGRDMGAAPPRQTEIKFELTGDTFQNKLQLAMTAYDEFGFPPIPEDAVQFVNGLSKSTLFMSVITSSEGFVRLGLLIPEVQIGEIEELCSMSGVSPQQLINFQSTLGVQTPEFVEFQYLMNGYGYGVYKEGFDIVFHFRVGEEHPV